MNEVHPELGGDKSRTGSIEAGLPKSISVSALLIIDTFSIEPVCIFLQWFAPPILSLLRLKFHLSVSQEHSF